MLKQALTHNGLIAILRGLRPEEALAIGEVLYTAGFRVIEVPLNSPDPYSSIRILRDSLPADCLIGAGTAADEWVRWTLAAASELRLPLFGASLAGPPPADAVDLLASFGAEIVPLDGAVIAHRMTGEMPRNAVRARAHEHPLSFAVRFMRLPLR